MSRTGNLSTTRGSRFFSFAVVLVFLLVSVAPVLAARPIPAWNRLAVLVYHHIEDPATSDVSCTPSGFAAQMEALLAAGYTPLSLDQTRQYLLGTLRGVKKPVFITFDDGYASLYAHALPVARRLQFPMTVFMVTNRMGRKPQFSRYLSEGEIREMADSGWFSFGSHTHDLHVPLVTILKAFRKTPNPVLAYLREDLVMSRRRLQQVAGRNILALAWPYGKHTPETRKVAREAGFTLQFTSVHGYNEPGSDPFEIKRIPVTVRDTPASVVRKAGGI